ncbi:hypothetical protein U1Q18_009504, partial [Sarracenia purpurea var. burkii]
GGAARKKAIAETQPQGRGARVVRRAIRQNVTACPIGKPFAGGGEIRHGICSRAKMMARVE